MNVSCFRKTLAVADGSRTILIGKSYLRVDIRHQTIDLQTSTGFDDEIRVVHEILCGREIPEYHFYKTCMMSHYDELSRTLVALRGSGCYELFETH